jgi:Histidine kinase-, DNA gyrase B-, and HSP90-like ATPase.
MAKLNWLVRLRWIAMLLFFLLAIPGLIYGVLTPTAIPPYLGIIGFLFVFNLLTQLIFIDARKPISAAFIGVQLSLDLLALSSLLLISGGVTNPLIGFFPLIAALAGVLLTGSISWIFVVIVHVMLWILQIHHMNEKPENIHQTFFISATVTHLLVFSFWLIMRSLSTQLEQQQESKAEMKIQFERQDRLRAVGAMAAGFSHEFASPLHSAKLRVERILRSAATENSTLKEDATEALKALEACHVVIEQMNSSQLDVREQALKSVPVHELIADITDSWKEAHPSAKLQLQLLSQTHVPLAAVSFAQVLINLLDNAYEAAPSNTITLRFVREDGLCRLSVLDKGPGFSELILTKYGEPFLTTKSDGTGLGLYVSQVFVHSMLGEMRLENKNGAHVILEWPV